MSDTGRYLGLASAKTEGSDAYFERGYRRPSPEEIAAAQAEYDARVAKWSPFAVRMANELNGNDFDDEPFKPGEYRSFYEVSHETLIEDIMKIEAALRKELAPK